MSKIERWDQYDGQMLRDSSGLWVRYDDYRAEIEGLRADLRDRNEVRIELNSAQIEATHLRTALTEAHDRCRALELSVEQADEMKAHAEASAAAEEAETDRVTAERDAVQVEAERLKVEIERLKTDPTTELGKAYGEIGQLRIELAAQDQRLGVAQEGVERLIVERDEAQAEVKRLIADRAAAEAAIERLKAEIEDANNWLQADARAIGRTNSELEQAKAEIERLKDKIATTPTFINFPWDTYERLKNANEHLKEDVATLTAERDAARFELNQLLTAHMGGRVIPGPGRDEAQAEVERLRTTLAEADGTIDGLRTELAEQDRKLETAQAEVKRLQAELEGKQCDQGILQTLLEGERAEVATLTTKCNAAQAKIDRLTWELLAKVNEAHRVTSKQDCLQSLLPEERKVSRLIGERDEALAEVERLQGDVERLRAERDLMATHPRGREVGRYGWGGHYIDAMEPERPTDEDIWREGFMRCLNDVAAEDWQAQADLVLTTYRKRWPR